MVVVLLGAAVLLGVTAFEVALTGGFEERGGVLLSEGTSSIGSSLTGVASPLSIDSCDGSCSSPGFFFFTFLVFRTLVVLDLFTEDEEDGGW